MLTASHQNELQQIVPIAAPVATVLAALLGSFVAAQTSRGKEQREEIRRLVGEVIAQSASLRDKVGKEATANVLFAKAPQARRWESGRARERVLAGNHLATALEESQAAQRELRTSVAQLEVIAPRLAKHAEALVEWSSCWMGGSITPQVYKEHFAEAESGLVAATRVATSRWFLRRRCMPKVIIRPAEFRAAARS